MLFFNWSFLVLGINSRTKACWVRLPILVPSMVCFFLLISAAKQLNILQCHCPNWSTDFLDGLYHTAVFICQILNALHKATALKKKKKKTRPSQWAEVRPSGLLAAYFARMSLKTGKTFNNEQASIKFKMMRYKNHTSYKEVMKMLN